MEYLRVSENSNLYRDNFSGAIVNSNLNEYNNYIQQKKFKEQEKNRIQKIESDLSDLKNDLTEIKNLLRSLSNES